MEDTTINVIICLITNLPGMNYIGIIESTLRNVQNPILLHVPDQFRGVVINCDPFIEAPLLT